jgi:hypothetical protein
MRSLREDDRIQDRDFNPEPQEYEAGVLPTLPQRSVYH